MVFGSNNTGYIVAIDGEWVYSNGVWQNEMKQINPGDTLWVEIKRMSDNILYAEIK
ncbi:MAG: hypothetical protein QXM68_02055 [Candidatus Aenigmatarchaeota archaeon]|nr:hypothetical protein [Candidatus Aenigmarchaeota archaeon]